jgi:predicted DNA-binding protein
MFTINLNFLDLSKEMEQYLEKEYSYLEKITGKSREYHFKEALTRYIGNIEGMEGIKETERIIKEKKYPHDYHIITALTSYIEDMEAIKILEKRFKDEKRHKVKYHIPQEAKGHLKQHYDENKRKELRK